MNKSMSRYFKSVIFLCVLFSLILNALNVKATSEISENVINTVPDCETYNYYPLTLNYSIGEEGFLKAANSGDSSGYTSSDFFITDEEKIWILATVKNDRPGNWMEANEVSLKFDIPDKYSKEAVIGAEIICPNADPQVYTDTIVFRSDEAFRLRYSYITTIQGFYMNEEKNKERVYDTDILSPEGLLLGVEERNGMISPLEKVKVYILVEVVKEKEIERLKSTKKGKGIVKSWNLIQKYADPHYFRTSYRNSSDIRKGNIGKLKGKEYNKLKKIAKKVTRKYKTDYEKMQALNEYIANRVYYDDPQLEKHNKDLKQKAYEVWKYKRSICRGYANLYWVMADAIGIPCMLIAADNHVYNAAYDNVGKRWVFIDVTWCSKNEYTKDKTWKKAVYIPKYFDMDLETLLREKAHEIYTVEGILKDNVYYSCDVKSKKKKDKYADIKHWKWTVIGKKDKKKKMKVHKKIAGIQVKQKRR